MKMILFTLPFLISLLAVANETPLITRDDMDAFNPSDRRAVYNYYQQNVKSCTMRTGRDATCGVIHGIGSGDSNFNDPFYAHIPQPTSVHVYTQCDEKERKFYTTVYYKDKQGKWKNFRNPLYEPSNNFNNGSRAERWLTSPGIYNYHPTNYPGTEDWKQGQTPEYGYNRWRTQLPATVSTGYDSYITEWHVVGDRKTWEGAQMPWSVWVNGDIAYHASNEVTGEPESHGCFRLKSTNAMALFNLVRRAGTANVSYHFGGYGQTNPKTGEPYCAGKYDKYGRLINDNNRVYASQGSPEKINQKSTQARNNVFNRIGRWFRKTFGTSAQADQPSPRQSEGSSR